MSFKNAVRKSPDYSKVLIGNLILGTKEKKYKNFYLMRYTKSTGTLQIQKNNKTIKTFASKKLANLKKNVKKYFLFQNYTICGVNLED